MPDMPSKPYSDLVQQHDAATLGIWVFLATEVLFFGGLILSYAVYRHAYPQPFADAARHTNIVIGTANTAILLTSSFLVAWGVEVAK
ncbi:MAG: cytochrome c oxidase subunit 3 family protein, partial [Bradyrhizobium sp.]|nr:cytochrome c oxidase subunit 3 family protein [Bradyrhizobium sp.]